MRRRGWALGALLVGCVDPIEPEQRDRLDVVMELQADPREGEKVFAERCSDCHDPERFAPRLSPRGVARQVLEGEAAVYAIMPSFADELSDQQIADVVAFVGELAP